MQILTKSCISVNAKWALVDDCLLEDVIWLREYDAPTSIFIDTKFGLCGLHIHKAIHTNLFNNDLVLGQNQVYELLTSSVGHSYAVGVLSSFTLNK